MTRTHRAPSTSVQPHRLITYVFCAVPEKLLSYKGKLEFDGYVGL